MTYSLSVFQSGTWQQGQDFFKIPTVTFRFHYNQSAHLNTARKQARSIDSDDSHNIDQNNKHKLDAIPSSKLEIRKGKMKDNKSTVAGKSRVDSVEKSLSLNESDSSSKKTEQPESQMRFKRKNMQVNSFELSNKSTILSSKTIAGKEVKDPNDDQISTHSEVTLDEELSSTIAKTISIPGRANKSMRFKNSVTSDTTNTEQQDPVEPSIKFILTPVINGIKLNTTNITAEKIDDFAEAIINESVTDRKIHSQNFSNPLIRKKEKTDFIIRIKNDTEKIRTPNVKKVMEEDRMQNHDQRIFDLIPITHDEHDTTNHDDTTFNNKYSKSSSHIQTTMGDIDHQVPKKVDRKKSFIRVNAQPEIKNMDHITKIEHFQGIFSNDESSFVNPETSFPNFRHSTGIPLMRASTEYDESTTRMKFPVATRRCQLFPDGEARWLEPSVEQCQKFVNFEADSVADEIATLTAKPEVINGQEFRETVKDLASLVEFAARDKAVCSEL